MKITQYMREYAAGTHGIAEETAAIAQGLREKAQEFGKSGGEIPAGVLHSRRTRRVEPVSSPLTPPCRGCTPMGTHCTLRRANARAGA